MTPLPSVVTRACGPPLLLEEPPEELLEELPEELLEEAPAAPEEDEPPEEEPPEEEPLEDEDEEDELLELEEVAPEELLEVPPTAPEDDEEVAPEEEELEEDDVPEDELLDEEPPEDEVPPDELSLLQAESAVNDSAAVSMTRGFLVSMVSFTGSVSTDVFMSFSSRPNRRHGAAAPPRIRNRLGLFGSRVAE